jgi:hypothetical protein
MSEIKPVLTANERVLNQYGRDTHLASDAVYIKEYANEVAELRAALEALQAENEELRLMLSGSTLQIQAMQAQINAMKIAQKVLDGVVQAQSISDSEWREKYMREVEGLNNEGDPIGGDPPSGLRHAVEYFKSENAAQAKEIEALRKQVEALGQTAPTASGFCSRDGGCVCGGDLPRIRESCSSWVKSAQKGTEHGTS